MAAEGPRRTAIVATLGPASANPDTIAALIAAGLDVARLNFSHGDAETHARVVGWVRAAAEAAGRPVAILQDLAGPKIRLGRLPEAGVTLDPGTEVTLAASEDATGTDLAVGYEWLAEDVSPGDPVLLADGALELEVLRVEGRRVCCRVVTGGVVTSRKGVNLPATRLRVPALTAKDRADLELGLELGVDLVALSFVRHEDDLEPVIERIFRRRDRPLLVAKIEKPQAVERFDRILPRVDGIMVARGDLGVEMPAEEVPLIQKRLIAEARRAARPVITATQMLRSMVASPRPTRAEAADVANAVLDGTDAVMLSEESAVGQYPVEAVRTLDRIARTAEGHVDHAAVLAEPLHPALPVTAASLARAACQVAADISARAIVAATTSGWTARIVAHFRPPMPVVGLTAEAVTARQLALSWGVVPAHLPELAGSEAFSALAARWCLDHGLAAAGEPVVVIAGLPLHEPGTTDVIRVVEAR